MEKKTSNLNEQKKVVIVGGGIAGLSAAYYLNSRGVHAVIYEQDENYGGLCASFDVQGYSFDYGGHVSFAKDVEVQHLLRDGVVSHESINNAYNFKAGMWVKHPVQNNLCVLETEEKVKILKDFFERPSNSKAEDYYEWLVNSYGTYFADNYPTLYTQKYWTVSPRMMETKWVGPRMYQPNTEEILKGAFEKETPDVHYSGRCYHPKEGGFGEFLHNLAKDVEIHFNSKISRIDDDNKLLVLEDSQTVEYDTLISTVPLPDMKEMLTGLPEEVIKAMDKLNYTSLVLISIGLKTKINLEGDAWYIYDEDILPARVYSTSSQAGHPDEKVTMQAEVYYSKFKPMDMSLEEIKNTVLEQLSAIGMFSMNDVDVVDVRYRKYANILFTPDIYANREVVHKELQKRNILFCGRFADWDYLWTDQTILSAKRLIEGLD